MADGWTVREAAERLLCSESKVRRRIADPGDRLSAVAESAVLRISFESLAVEQADMLRRMGLPEPLVQGACSDDVDTGRSADGEVEALRAELRQVKGALADLTAAHSAILDTFRRISDGAIPNR